MINMKKILPIFVIMALVLSGLGAVASSGVIDQYQELCSGYIPIGCDVVKITHNYTAAQSFIPQKNVLTQVELNMSRLPSTSYPCYIAIRENLTDTINLVEMGLGPDNFSVYDGDMNLTWTEFNFEDIRVTIGDIYYIVVYTSATSDNFYLWGGHGGRDISPYPNGTLYRSDDGGEIWNEHIMSDACFRTYGKDDEAPTIEFVNPASGYLHCFGVPIISTPFQLFADAIAIGGFKSQPVQVNVTDDFDSEDNINVTFFLCDEKSGDGTYNTENGFYEWKWTDYGYGKCTLKATAEDSCGNIGSSEMTVWYICLFEPIL